MLNWFRKNRYTAGAIIFIIIFIASLQIYTILSKKQFKETHIFRHPAFKGYNLRFITVTFVYDGDTVKLSNGTVIRYLGIDTPEIAHSPGEKSEKGAEKAKETNKEMTAGKKILLVIPEKNKFTYERLLAYIYAPKKDGYINLTQYLLKNKLGDSKYGKPDPDLPYRIKKDKLLTQRRFKR